MADTPEAAPMREDDDDMIDVMRESTIGRIVGPTIMLGSGTYFDFDAPEQSEMTIEDVAYGLAFACRFAGQAVSRATGKRVFYSVAEHCVRMSYIVPPGFEYDALMHELGEPTCGDMTGPLKSKCPDYKAVEKRCEAAGMARFDVPMTDPVLIKRFDLIMLATEKRDLMPMSDGHRWEWVKGAEPLPDIIEPWDAHYAAERFLDRYNELRGLPRLAHTARPDAGDEVEEAPDRDPDYRVVRPHRTEITDYSEQALADCQIDFLEARADEWMAETGVRRMFNAIASVFEKYAPQEIMDRFREKLGVIGRQCHVEGALRVWEEIAQQQREIGRPLPADPMDLSAMREGVDGAEFNEGVPYGVARVYSRIPAVVAPIGPHPASDKPSLSNHHYIKAVVATPGVKVGDWLIGEKVSEATATHFLVHSLTVETALSRKEPIR
jgi:hypothetical protein